MAEFYRACEAFAIVDENGCPRPITPGTLVSSDDPAYKGRESMFEPIEASVARATAARTETTSAAPGELRAQLTKPPAKAAAKKATPPASPATEPTPEPKGDN